MNKQHIEMYRIKRKYFDSFFNKNQSVLLFVHMLGYCVQLFVVYVYDHTVWGISMLIAFASLKFFFLFILFSSNKNLKANLKDLQPFVHVAIFYDVC